MRFWRLTIEQEIENTFTMRKKRFFQVVCDCWKHKNVSLDNLRTWWVKSCWCLQADISKVTILLAIKRIDNKTHWMTGTKAYNTYHWILDRCTNPKNKRYKNYWWRGIKCEWNTFEDFFRDMGNSCKEWLEIDRINVNGNYSKENCRWVTPLENSRNKQNTIFVDGLCLKEYCQNNKLNYKKIHARIRRWKLLQESLY